MEGVYNVVDLIRRYGDIAAMLPRFAQHVRNFVTTLGMIVDDLVAAYFEPSSKLVGTTSEVRAICHELRQIMVHSNAYLAKVDDFVWHAKRQDRQRKVQEALRQEPPKLEPLKEYLLQLASFLGRTEETYKIFEDSFKDIISRLDEVLDDCSKQLNEAENKEHVTRITSVTGAVVGAGAVTVGLAAVAAIPTMGVGSMIILAFGGGGAITAGLGIAVTTAGASYLIVEYYRKLKSEIQALTMQVNSITSFAESIETTVTEIRSELGNIRDLKDEVESNYELPESLLECVELLFERLIEFGTTCSECHQELKEKKYKLNDVIYKCFAPLDRAANK